MKNGVKDGRQRDLTIGVLAPDVSGGGGGGSVAAAHARPWLTWLGEEWDARDLRRLLGQLGASADCPDKVFHISLFFSDAY